MNQRRKQQAHTYTWVNSHCTPPSHNNWTSFNIHAPLPAKHTLRRQLLHKQIKTNKRVFNMNTSHHTHSMILAWSRPVAVTQMSKILSTAQFQFLWCRVNRLGKQKFFSCQNSSFPRVTGNTEPPNLGQNHDACTNLQIQSQNQDHPNQIISTNWNITQSNKCDKLTVSHSLWPAKKGCSLNCARSQQIQPVRRGGGKQSYWETVGSGCWCVVQAATENWKVIQCNRHAPGNTMRGT